MMCDKATQLTVNATAVAFVFHDREAAATVLQGGDPQELRHRVRDPADALSFEADHDNPRVRPWWVASEVGKVHVQSDQESTFVDATRQQIRIRRAMQPRSSGRFDVMAMRTQQRDQRGRKIFVSQELHLRLDSVESCVRKDFFSRDRRRILDGCLNIRFGELGVFLEDLSDGHAIGKGVQDNGHHDPSASDTYLAMADVRIDADSVHPTLSHIN